VVVEAARHLNAPPGFFGGASVCLHRLDPRRRKSPIIPAPDKAAISASAWSTIPATASRTPLCSTVSFPPYPRALPGRLGFPGPWHARTPRNASCTDFPLRDRKSRRLWGIRNGRLAQGSPFGPVQLSRTVTGGPVSRVSTLNPRPSKCNRGLRFVPRGATDQRGALVTASCPMIDNGTPKKLRNNLKRR